jgi:hypothetical protein
LLLRRNPGRRHRPVNALPAPFACGSRVGHGRPGDLPSAVFACVRKGEHGTSVVYANRLHKTEIDQETGEEIARDIPFMKGYTVFNVEQIDGLPAHYYAHEIEPVLEPVQRDARAEAFFAQTGDSIHHGGNRAYYAPGPDHIGTWSGAPRASTLSSSAAPPRRSPP